MKEYVLIAALLLGGGITAGESDTRVEENNLIPLPLPVEVAEGKELDLGVMYSNELRTFRFTLKNTSNRPLEYNQVVVNCSCSKPQIPVPGLIAPGESFVVPIELDAQKISEMGAFRKTIRFDFPGYQSLQLIFTGLMSSELRIFQLVSGKEHLAKSIPVHFIESINEAWERSLDIKADFTDVRKLEFGEPTLEDSSSHRCQLTKVAENHWRLLVTPVLPQKLGLIQNQVILPILAPNAGSRIRLSLEGMVGTHIEASTDEVYWDPKADSKQVKKAFTLTRLPFNDRALRVAMLLGRPNPYTDAIKVLTTAEVKVPQVPGVSFELVQGRGGVFVQCLMQGDKMPAEGFDAEFQVEGSEGCTVRFAVMDAATRKALQELEKEEDEEAAEGEEH